MKSTNTPALIITLLLVVAGVYWYFFTGSSDEQLPISEITTENQAQTRFQMLVGELTPISFDTSLFSDARFNALVDLSTPIAPETVGRLDPFAPITGLNGN
jgi:hypothetical protein